jgi:hypothetical protein
MRATALTSLTSLVLVLDPCAQAPNACDVKRNNEPYYYTSTTPDPVTGRPYNQPIYQPPGYWSQTANDPGVAAGSSTWRWIPSDVNLRLEPRAVSGFYVWLRPSASTVQFPTTGYVPEWKLHPVAVRGDGGFRPDLTAPPFAVVPEASFVFATAGAARARVAFSQAVALNAREVAFSLRWRGGEHRLRPASQGFVGTAQEAPWRVPTWGHADPQQNVTVVDPLSQVGQYTTLWAGYYEAAPSIVAESDYAHQRVLPSQPPLYSGFNDAAGLCDLATRDLWLGWNVDGGAANAGNWALPLLNLAPGVHGAPTTFLGVTFELDLTSPVLGELAALGYGGVMDHHGVYDGPRLPIPLLPPSAIGNWIGVEFLILRADLGAIVGSTQAHWLQVVQ